MPKRDRQWWIRVTVSAVCAITATSAAWFAFGGRLEPWQALAVGYLSALAGRTWRLP